jgi:hypothetical protein
MLQANKIAPQNPGWMDGWMDGGTDEWINGWDFFFKSSGH